jgi:Flp pilus assembly protein TadD
MVIRMVKRGWQQADRAPGIRVAGPTWGRRLGVRRGLAVLALLGALAAAGIGCTAPVTGYGQADETAVLAKVRRGPGELSRLLQNARYYKMMGQPALALKELEQAHQQDPDNLAIVNTLAHNYEELGKFEAARKLYREALTRHGPQPALANNLCFTYYLQGRYAEAETCFRQTLAQDPRNMAARNNLGLLYCRLGRVPEARRLWQEAEGEAAAERKVSEALAALGMKETKVYAQAPKPAPSLYPKASAPVKAMAPAPPPAVAPKPEPAVAKAAPVKAEAPPLTAQPVVKPPVPAAPPVAQAAPVKAAPPAPPPVVTPKPEPVVAKAAPAKAEAAPPAPQPVAKPPVPAAPIVAQAAPAKAPETPKAPAAASPAPARSGTHLAPVYLSTAELLDNPIEVRNGTWSHNLAHQVRSLLNLEGFTVAIIGNHIDFGVDKTIIFYRPGAARVAQALRANIFRTASLEETSKLKNQVAVKVLLGRDLLDQADLMARLGEGEVQPLPAPKQPAKPDKLLAALAPAARPAPGQLETQAVPPTKVAPPEPPFPPQSRAPVTQKLPAAAPEPLTAAELMGTPIEVRNGTWTPKLAHQVRTLLNLEGFTVAIIGNHIDFGAQKTIIFYRPGAEKVARALASKFFPGATLESSEKLKKEIGVKILLGADLLQCPNLMARLAAEGKE